MANSKNDGSTVSDQRAEHKPSPENIFQEGELVEEATIKDFLIVQKEGSRSVERNHQL